MERGQKVMKRRLALFFGYSGTDYSGMQYQKDPTIKTIENQLIDKLYTLGFLKTDVFVQLVSNWKWSRAARTDKGVHALFNAFSCIFTIPKDFVFKGQQGQEIDKLKMAKCIQEALPQFSIYTLKEVDRSNFLMRQSVKSRVYCYICPIHLFHKDTTDTQQILDKINRMCGLFVGTRNYHNYSSGVKAKDPSAKRFILQMGCKAHQKNGQWVRFEIKGQSFIYHQIRKMVGSIVQMFHEGQPQNFLENTFFNNIIYILLAPADGLYLKSLNFDSYNRKENIPEKLLFDDLQEILDEKQQVLEGEIIEHEDRIGNFEDWLRKLRHNEIQEEVVLGIVEIQE